MPRKQPFTLPATRDGYAAARMTAPHDDAFAAARERAEALRRMTLREEQRQPIAGMVLVLRANADG